MNQQERNDIKQLIREVIVESVPSVVDTTLERFGFNVDEPNTMQQDMAHLHRLRVGSEYIKTVTIKTCFGALVTGLLCIIGLGIKAWLAVVFNPNHQ